MAVESWAGPVSFLSPAPTGLCLVLEEVAGAAWLSLVSALSDQGPAPLSALSGEFMPCQEAPLLPAPHPLQEQKGGPTTAWVSEIAGITSWARPAGGGGWDTSTPHYSSEWWGLLPSSRVDMETQSPLRWFQIVVLWQTGQRQNHSDLGTVNDVSELQFPHL